MHHALPAVPDHSVWLVRWSPRKGVFRGDRLKNCMHALLLGFSVRKIHALFSRLEGVTLILLFIMSNKKYLLFVALHGSNSDLKLQGGCILSECCQFLSVLRLLFGPPDADLMYHTQRGDSYKLLPTSSCFHTGFCIISCVLDSCDYPWLQQLVFKQLFSSYALKFILVTYLWTEVVLNYGRLDGHLSFVRACKDTYHVLLHKRFWK